MERKVALVTGAGVRLGQAVAAALAREGYDLLLHVHRSEPEALAGRVETVRADLSRREGVRELVQEALTRFGRLDLLVNNAALFWPSPLERALDDWDRFRGLNLEAPLGLAVGLAPRLRASGGAIINLADIYGERPLKGHLPYCLSKAGVIMLTRCLALELAPEVRCNAVSPGAALPPAESDPEHERRLVEKIPLARLGGAEAVARAVVFLARAEFVTGQVLQVDGGRTLV
ncbi:SDR family oxidoreductase [bacterium CPR1]|nr:SDR family oxidoreductase [bacterium CPR1]